MTTIEHTPDPALEQLLREANPVSDTEISAMGLDAQFADLLEHISSSEDVAPIDAPRRGRFSRRSVAVIAAATAILSTGGVAAARWTSAHTGAFGSPGMTESDTSEWLDSSADDFPQLARRLATAIPYPADDSADSYIPKLQGAGLIQVTGVKMNLAMDAQCAWEGYWLQARSEGNDAEQAVATRVLAQVPTWPVLVATDGAGVVAGARQVAQAATTDQPGRVQQAWAANCESLPRNWATK